MCPKFCVSLCTILTKRNKCARLFSVNSACSLLQSIDLIAFFLLLLPLYLCVRLPDLLAYAKGSSSLIKMQSHFSHAQTNI